MKREIAHRCGNKGIKLLSICIAKSAISFETIHQIWGKLPVVHTFGKDEVEKAIQKYNEINV